MTENQRVAKDDIPAVWREIRMVQAFHGNCQWRLSFGEETGNIRIFEEQNEVVFDARGCYCIMTEEQASEYQRTASVSRLTITYLGYDLHMLWEGVSMVCMVLLYWKYIKP